MVNAPSLPSQQTINVDTISLAINFFFLYILTPLSFARPSISFHLKILERHHSTFLQGLAPTNYSNHLAAPNPSRTSLQRFASNVTNSCPLWSRLITRVISKPRVCSFGELLLSCSYWVILVWFLLLFWVLCCMLFLFSTPHLQMHRFMLSVFVLGYL